MLTAFLMLLTLIVGSYFFILIFYAIGYLIIPGFRTIKAGGFIRNGFIVSVVSFVLLLVLVPKSEDTDPSSVDTPSPSTNMDTSSTQVTPNSTADQAKAPVTEKPYDGPPVMSQVTWETVTRGLDRSTYSDYSTRRPRYFGTTRIILEECADRTSHFGLVKQSACIRTDSLDAAFEVEVEVFIDDNNNEVINQGLGFLIFFAKLPHVAISSEAVQATHDKVLAYLNDDNFSGKAEWVYEDRRMQLVYRRGQDSTYALFQAWSKDYREWLSNSLE